MSVEDTATTSLLSSVLTTAAVLHARATELLNGTDLTLDRWRVLDLVNREADLTMSSLACRLAVPTTTATRLVDHLVLAGAVYRVVDPSDRRRVVLEIAERGKEMLREVAPKLHVLEVELISDNQPTTEGLDGEPVWKPAASRYS